MEETEVQRSFEEAFEKSLSTEPWKGAGLYGSYLSSPADIRGAFLDIWPLIDGILERPIGAEKALDAVLIATPDHLHATICIAAMKKGKNVMVHKPLANRMYEARLVIDTARTIDFMGEAARVYATPMLVRDIEMTARDLLLEHGADPFAGVGTVTDLDA